MQNKLAPVPALVPASVPESTKTDTETETDTETDSINDSDTESNSSIKNSGYVSVDTELHTNFAREDILKYATQISTDSTENQSINLARRA
jgi:hypothetical protein